MSKKLDAISCCNELIYKVPTPHIKIILVPLLRKLKSISMIYVIEEFLYR